MKWLLGFFVKTVEILFDAILFLLPEVKGLNI
jgi:hypothetical protein